MLSPYARRAGPRPPSAVDRWAGPGWRLLERHEARVAAAPDASLTALARVRLHELRPVRILFALRGLRLSPGTTLRGFFSTPPFLVLEEEAGRELVAGVLLPPRGPAGRRAVPETPQEFGRLAPRAPVAVVATFRADPGEHGSLLWTETWVRTRGAVATALFAAYWLAIGPWSAWTRRIFLRAARDAVRGR